MAYKLILSAAAIAVLAACNGTSDAETGGDGDTELADGAGNEAGDAADEDSSDEAGETSEKASDAAQKTAPASTELTCTNPVKAGDTGKSLRERYGDDAKLEEIDGGEGTKLPGVVLWDGDPKRVVEIGFDDEARTKLSFARVFEGSDWTLAKLEVGDTLERVLDINNKPIKFYGFEWDYGGTVTNFGGGELDGLAPCKAGMRLDYDFKSGKIDDAMVGDQEVSSTMPEADKALILVSELSVGFPF